MTYSHFNSEEGPNKGPRLRPEPLTINNNGTNPPKRSHKGVEFQTGIQTEMNVNTNKLASTPVSGESTRSTGK